MALGLWCDLSTSGGESILERLCREETMASAQWQREGSMDR